MEQRRNGDGWWVTTFVIGVLALALGVIGVAIAAGQSGQRAAGAAEGAGGVTEFDVTLADISLTPSMIEVPAGKIDAGESPLATARRELREETGYTALKWRHLATTHIAIGYSDERIEIYLARGLEHFGAKLDDEEFLEVFTLPLDAAAMQRGYV